MASEHRHGWQWGVLGVAFLATLLSAPGVWTTGRQLWEHGQPLGGPKAPRGVQSLALAATRDEADEAVAAWAKEADPESAELSTCGGREPCTTLDRARAWVRLDDEVFVARYTRFGAALAAFAWALAFLWDPTDRKRAGIAAGALVLTLAALFVADKGENAGLLALLDRVRTLARGPWALDALAATRALAQVKFVALLLFSLGVLTLLGMGLHRQGQAGWARALRPRKLDTSPRTKPKTGSFRELVLEELEGVLGPRAVADARSFSVEKEAAGEPWLKECRDQLVGLALSGGGIRSATFNLGLLQGLHRLDILACVDYLATVSGGGYVGGFWSTWLARCSGTHRLFPDAFKEWARTFSGDSRVFEAEEVRHLREFGNFLVPRTGFFETETWGAVVSILAGLLPAVAAALSVLALSLLGWLGLTFYLACPSAWGRAAFVAGLTALVLLAFELWWRRHPTGEDRSVARVLGISLGAVLLAGVGAWASPWRGSYPVFAYRAGNWLTLPADASYGGWWEVIGVTAYSPGQIFSPAVFELAFVWSVAALALLSLRFRGAFHAPSQTRRVTRSASDRTAMRLLGMVTAWTLLGLLWHVGLNLARLEFAIPATAAGAVTAGSVFALLRNWVGAGLSRPAKARLPEQLRPYVPVILAYVTVGLSWALVATALVTWGGNDWMRWYAAAFVAGTLALLVLVVDPHEFGLHAFYRDRICRAYLGAARPVPTAATNRQTDLREEDDIGLEKLLARPLHLVCCAANHLHGDHLSTLSRGSRSAVLSRHGVAMGDTWAAQEDLSLGSAVTASAAAFNSNMGSVSMRVGPAVSFLMAALNLRLGLWVSDPRRAKGRRLLPGWLFYREMFAATDTDAGDLHLSDGAHFDNLGLYELVRRHCRYVIVSDCTADPEVAFDDFGNAARRIREDFGVEINVDLEPLKPNAEGRSLQHAVVGTIDYGWFDKGILVYVKPTLGGSEPPDIRQYKTRNRAFPHEGTGDQFYDEAQWESYRRLGVHIAREVFGFSERFEGRPSSQGPGIRPTQWTQSVFHAARQAWYPAPPGLADRMFEMTRRFEQVEVSAKGGEAPTLTSEVFPEAEHVRLRPSERPALTEEAEIANLDCLARVIQLMEDTYFACSLETHWSHPLNLGWVNLFARWATAPTFRTWWPLLKPLYSPAFRAFLESRFEVLKRSQGLKGQVARGGEPGVAPPGLAATWWREREPMPDLEGRVVYQYCITLPVRERPLQVALAAVKEEKEGASWTSDHFFVPVSLWGGEIGRSFLAKLLEALTGRGITRVEVMVRGPYDSAAGAAQWEERRGFVDFYRSVGFVLETVKEYKEAAESLPCRAAVLVWQPPVKEGAAAKP